MKSQEVILKSSIKTSITKYLPLFSFIAFSVIVHTAYANNPIENTVNKQSEHLLATDYKELVVGDLELEIPTISIPVEDVEDFPLNLTYKSGIKMDDEADWTGLGFTFKVGDIRQNVKGLPDDFPVQGYLYNSKTDTPDEWTFRIKGITFKLVIENGKFIIPFRSEYKIEHTTYKNQDGSDGRIQYFSIKGPKNVTYILGTRAGSRDEPKWNGWNFSFFQIDEWAKGSDTPFCEKRPCKQYYSGTWELTEVHFNDYSDTNNNLIADEHDSGNWIRFIYQDYTDKDECGGNLEGCPYYFPSGQNWDDAIEYEDRFWKTPPGALSKENPDVFKNWVLTDSEKQIYTSARVEIGFIFLRKIMTRTYHALISVDDREDFRSPSMKKSRAKKIKNIKLFETASSNLIKEVLFTFDENYSLCQGTPNNPTGRGKLALKSITVCSRDNGESECNPSIEFEYANGSNPGFGDNALFNQFAVDLHGYYNGYTKNKNNVDGNHYPNDKAKAWSLTKIKNLNGKSYRYVYDTSRFAYRADYLFFGM